MKKQRDGGAMVVALLLALIASGTALAVLAHSSQSANQTMRMLNYQRAKIAAEAGLDYGIVNLVDILRQYQFVLGQSELQSLLDNVPAPPQVGSYIYQTPGGDTAFRISRDSDVGDGVIPDGSIASGEDGQYQFFTITCGAIDPVTGVGAVLKEQVMAISVFLMRFGVFYEADLEILPGPTMSFEGWVHSNSDMYVGGPLEFHDKLTSHQDIYHHRKDEDVIHGEAYVANEDGQLVSMHQYGTWVDSDYSDWMIEALSLWDGRVKSEAHAVPYMAPPINPLDVPHDIIERPIEIGYPGYSELTENEKFANKAAITIHVDAGGDVTVTDYYGTDVTDRFSPAAPQANGTYNGRPLYDKQTNGSYRLSTEGSYDTTKTFFDGREDRTMAPVDIYVDQLVAEYPELYQGTTYGVTEGRGVVYVTRDDPDGDGGVIPAVRLRNGTSLPEAGLTFATDLPIYIEGNYNTSDKKPALVTGDAVTMLSVNWQDAKSTAGINTRLAQSTTYNTVIMTGNSETQAPQYNGGLENVLRFQENWSGRTVTFRGSIIDLWYAEEVTGPWEYGNYYTAPNRNWGFDTMYRRQAPPGIPRVFGIEQISWEETTARRC